MQPSATEPPAPDSPGLSHRVMEQAAEWYALLACGEATDRDRDRWQAWLDDDAEHLTAWRYVESISSRFDPVRAMPSARRAVDGVRTAHAHALHRRRMLSGLGALACFGVGWAAWRHTALPGVVLAQRSDHRTAIGERRALTLPDGTRVWLNTATALDQDYSATLRRLRLVAGEILVDTAPDAGRPLVVDTPQGRLTALGTRFLVHEAGEAVLLAVHEGAVQIRTRAGATTILQAGQRTRYTAAAIDAAAPADPTGEAWTRGMLIANGLSLGEVVEELRRYRRGHIGLAPEVAGLRVSGGVSLDDTDQALALLASVLPIRIHRRFSWWVSIEAAPQPAPR